MRSAWEVFLEWSGKYINTEKGGNDNNLKSDIFTRSGVKNINTELYREKSVS